MLTVTRRTVGAETILELEGRLDGGHPCQALRDCLCQEIEAGRRSFVLNMEKLQWMNSAGLQCLIRAYTHVRRVDGSFALSSPNHRVLTVLRISGLVPKVFSVVAASHPQIASRS